MNNKINKCPCGSESEYKFCCRVYHDGELSAPTPEALMRSRYSAYALGDINYIQKTMCGEASINFNGCEAEAWTKSVKWLELAVIDVENVSPQLGYVSFVARFIEDGQIRSIHEKSEFHRMGDQWFYTDGVHLNVAPSSKKVGRNMLCPCGSQKKFKHCHGKTDGT